MSNQERKRIAVLLRLLSLILSAGIIGYMAVTKEPLSTPLFILLFGVSFFAILISNKVRRVPEPSEKG